MSLKGDVGCCGDMLLKAIACLFLPHLAITSPAVPYDRVLHLRKLPGTDSTDNRVSEKPRVDR